MSILKRRKFKTQLGYYSLAIFPIAYLVIFNYLPMFGVVMAFMDFKPTKGFFGSRWVGFQNFTYFFESNDAMRIIRNTLLYNLAFLFIIGLFIGILIAVLLYEIRSRICNKIYQTSMLLTTFLSWVVASAVLLIFLNPDSGIINNIRVSLGLERISWYTEAKYWPIILTICQIWKDAGMASIYFYAAILDIDYSLFESASLDGASRIKQIWHITLPHMKQMACIVIILRLGQIMSSSFDSFYLLPLNQERLYPTTDVISTYLYRGLSSGAYSSTAAVGLFQSVVGLALVLISNAVIRKISPDDALF